MKADFELIKRLTSGAAVIKENNGFYEFFRMTDQQGEILKNINDFYMKSTASSGIRMDFITDAGAVEFSGRFAAGTSRKYAFFDIYVNGVLLAHPGSADHFQNPDFTVTLQLDGKANRVTIYFPCLAKTELKSFELINAAKVEPVRKNRKILCYGDSITQGYDAEYPSFAYANMLADALDAEIFNKAIGAEVFNPPFADAPDEFTPDIISIAYGTNDWSKQVTAENIEKNATDFVKNLRKHYPDAPIIAILPIWRKDMNESRNAGQLSDAVAVLKKVYAKFDKITVVEGMPLVPHLPEFYADGYLHPNDTGFLLYGNNLVKNLDLTKFC